MTIRYQSDWKSRNTSKHISKKRFVGSPILYFNKGDLEDGPLSEGPVPGNKTIITLPKGRFYLPHNYNPPVIQNGSLTCNVHKGCSNRHTMVGVHHNSFYGGIRALIGTTYRIIFSGEILNADKWLNDCSWSLCFQGWQGYPKNFKETGGTSSPPFAIYIKRNLWDITLLHGDNSKEGWKRINKQLPINTTSFLWDIQYKPDNHDGILRVKLNRRVVYRYKGPTRTTYDNYGPALNFGSYSYWDIESPGVSYSFNRIEVESKI